MRRLTHSANNIIIKILGGKILLGHLGDGVSEVGEERNVQPAQPALLAGRVHPGQVGEVGVHAAGHHLGQQFSHMSTI